MRWEALFADLESEILAAAALDLDAEVAERVRGELARRHLVDRLRAALGAPLALAVQGAAGVAVSGRLRSTGPDWLLLAEDGRDEVLVPLAAVVWLQGLPPGAAPPPSGAAARVAAGLDLRTALRVLARDRAQVGLGLTDGSDLSVVVDRVGADHLDVAVTAGEERRRAAVRAFRTVPLAAVAAVRRH